MASLRRITHEPRVPRPGKTTISDEALRPQHRVSLGVFHILKHSRAFASAVSLLGLGVCSRLTALGPKILSMSLRTGQKEVSQKLLPNMWLRDVVIKELKNVMQKSPHKMRDGIVVDEI